MVKKLILDSGVAVNFNKNQPRFRFLNAINISFLRLATVVLPLSFYNVREGDGGAVGNNLIKFTDEGDVTRTAVLPSRQYTGIDLAEKVADALSDASDLDFTSEYDVSTGKLDISANGNFSIKRYDTTAHRVIGLSGDTANSNNTRLQNHIDLTGCQLVLLSSPELTSGDNIVYAGREGLNILELIPVQQDLGTVQVYENPSHQFIDVKDRQISELSFVLYNAETMERLDLNGESFQVILEVI